MKTTRKFQMVSSHDHENELNDLKKTLLALSLEVRATYDKMTVEEYDKYHRIRKDLEGLETMLELGSTSELKRLLMFMGKDSKKIVPSSVLSMVGK